MELSVKQIADACGGELVLRGLDGDTKVSCVVLDSRQLEKGGVFLATRGERVDGHKFIGQVFENGAALVITEKSPKQVEAECGVPACSWKSYLLVKDSFRALKEIGEAYRRSLSIPVVGITGSVGKTSTKEFIAGVLAEKFRVLKTEGNYNNEIGVPLTLLRIRSEHQVAVVEMGISDFGEMHRLSKMARPDICVITNIGQCHLENLKTRDGILKAKTEMFDFMAPEGKVCLNGEDDKLQSVTAVHGKKPHFFGLGGAANEEVYADAIESRGLKGSDAKLHFVEDGATLKIHIPLPGVHMVINAAAAACVARLLGLSEEQIGEGISKVSAIGGRNNLIWLSEYTLIDDCYNANPVSMKAAIDLLAMADTQRVALLGDMFELGEDAAAMHAEVGEYAASKGIEHIYCVGENSRHMYDAARKAAEDFQRVSYFESRESLLHALSEEREDWIPKHSTVLLKASHGMHFTEILEYLKEQA